MSEKSIFEKLQLKPGRTLLLVNPPVGYLDSAAAILSGAHLTLEPTIVDILQVFLRSMSELANSLENFSAFVKPGGMLWIAYPRLTSSLKSDLNRDTINRFAQAHGWIGIAMISIDSDWSALRLKRL